MHHARLLVHEAHSRHEAAQDLARLGLAEVPLLADVLQQLPALQQLQNQVCVQLRAECGARSPPGSRSDLPTGEPTDLTTPSPPGPTHWPGLRPSVSPCPLFEPRTQDHPKTTLRPQILAPSTSSSNSVPLSILGSPFPSSAQIPPPCPATSLSAPTHAPSPQPWPPASSPPTPALCPSPRKGHLVVMHVMQLHHVWMRLAKP